MAIRVIETSANVILTFEEAEQSIYDAPLSLTLPGEGADALERLEIDVVRQLLAPQVAAEGKASLDDLVKISVAYSMTGLEGDERIDLGSDPGVRAALAHLMRHRAKYYFQPNQRDDYEQRLVDALGIASRTRDFQADA